MGFRVDGFDNFVLYTADSMGGSSGSPVFGAAFDKMVALHHHGTDAKLHPNLNRGVLACRILAWLEQQPCKAPRSQLSEQVEDEPDMKDPRVRALAKICVEHTALVPKETRRQLEVGTHSCALTLQQVFVPLMYGRTEAESSGSRQGLKSLSDLASQLIPRPDDAALEEKGTHGDSGALQRQASLAPWSTQSGQALSRDIVLVQGPAGSGKSLFAWSLYSRFGQFT